MNNPGLIKSCDAAGEVDIYQLVSVNDGVATRATGPTVPVVGVALHHAEAGQRVDVVMSGIAEVKLGGAVSAGDKIAANADGNAAAAGAGDRYLGIALSAGVEDDVVGVLLAQG